jgi:hypothetical protein
VRAFLLILCLLLAACGSTPGPRYGSDALREPVSCVPYARARSGIMLGGDAWEWWSEASGRYERRQRPAVGSILVLDKTSRLRDGHLSYVTRIVSAREIRVDHANWDSGYRKGRIARDQPVIDVSPRNDWSMVRVWYPPVEALGQTSYPVLGFVGNRSYAER